LLVTGVEALPDQWHASQITCNQAMMRRRLELEVEADAMASCVQTNAHTPWRGIAMHATTHPVMACHVGDRSRTSAKRLGAKMPDTSRQHATGYTDPYVAYARVIPTAQPRAISTLARNTPHIERFNHTLRPRVITRGP
jgi:insertion element IS1 protein InsB